MNDEEAKIITKIMMTADGGCSYCAFALIEQLADAFPEQKQAMQEVIKSEGYEYIIGE